jgi:hypothetical protein
MKNVEKQFRLWFDRLRDPFLLLLVTLLPLKLTFDLWQRLWHGASVRSLDGTGHYAVAQIYARSIFPDTFGWAHVFFGGMPFPNFYPPLFYWLIGLLSSTGVLSFDSAFKLVLAVSVLLLPPAVWGLAWTLSRRDRVVATSAALALLPLLVDPRFTPTNGPSGLDYLSTFILGLYTQPLGFVLLVSWYAIYTGPHLRRARFMLATVLLSLTVLTNFFNCITATVFVAATLLCDALRFYREANQAERQHLRRGFTAHLVSPILAALLASFWLLPMLTEYPYFVTRPVKVSSFVEAIPAAMWGWYVIAELGVIFWFRRATNEMRPFLIACTCLGLIVVFDATLAPTWFPLQSTRFLATLNFLLAVPAGYTIATIYRAVLALVDRVISGRLFRRVESNSPRILKGILQCSVISGLGLLLSLAFFRSFEPAPFDLAFYSVGNINRIDGVLRFAQSHNDGRYVVEVPFFSPPPVNSLDSRAINSYLGMQGNAVLGGVFREASPNAIFFNPLINVFSGYPDSFGISSVLADDLDFANQPIERHLERLSMVGVKYLVIVTPGIKDRLSGEAGVKTRYDFGAWTVFELRRDPAPHVRALLYKPALVISSFSFKQRRRNEYDFVRLAQEEFADGWFDVLIALSPVSKIDRLDKLDQFGALILDTYAYDDEQKAFERLQDFATRHPLILISSDSPLFHRIKAAVHDFTFAEIIERIPEPPGELVDSEVPSLRYGSNSVRKTWQTIRNILAQKKSAIDADTTTDFIVRFGPKSIEINVVQPQIKSVPVLIATTYHPNWRRKDGELIYPATPFYMLTFVQRPIQLLYARRWYDWLGVIVSSCVLCGLCCFTAWSYRHKLRRAYK